MKIFRIIVPVSDIERAATFYSEVLASPGQRISPGRHYFFYGEVILACFDPRADGDAFDARPNPDHVYIATDDLEGAYARATKAGAGQGRVPLGIETRPWGERSFYVTDPLGNPLCFVDEKKFLGLGCDVEAFLGALNAAGESRGSRALIFIDALNEGEGLHVWNKHLAGMLVEISRYPWIGIALSVRQSYESEIVPPNLVPDKLLKVYHRGFEGFEADAVTRFFAHYKIATPGIPLFQMNRRVFKAYLLKESLERLWDYRYEGAI